MSTSFCTFKKNVLLYRRYYLKWVHSTESIVAHSVALFSSVRHDNRHEFLFLQASRLTLLIHMNEQIIARSSFVPWNRYSNVFARSFFIAIHNSTHSLCCRIHAKFIPHPTFLISIANNQFSFYIFSDRLTHLCSFAELNKNKNPTRKYCRNAFTVWNDLYYINFELLILLQIYAISIDIVDAIKV